jgi:hypothetical protein
MSRDSIIKAAHAIIRAHSHEKQADGRLANALHRATSKSPADALAAARRDGNMSNNITKSLTAQGLQGPRPVVIHGARHRAYPGRGRGHEIDQTNGKTVSVKIRHGPSQSGSPLLNALQNESQPTAGLGRNLLHIGQSLGRNYSPIAAPAWMPPKAEKSSSIIKAAHAIIRAHSHENSK